MTKEHEGARPAIGVAGRAAEPRTPNHESPDPVCIVTRAAAVRQIQIADLLLHGEQNALPLRYLKSVTGMNGRELRRMIQRERLTGAPILSNCVGGYYLPSSETELEHFVRSMQSRAKEIEAVAAAVEKGNGGLSEQTPYTVPKESL